MHVMTMKAVAADYAGREIFSDLSWAVSDNARVGLIGPNGSGKSTLLKMLAGVLRPYRGTITRARGVSVGLLPQDVDLPSGQTLLETALTLPPDLARIETQLNAVEEQLDDPEVYEDFDKLTRVLERQQALLEAYEELGIAQHPGRVRELLHALGFTPDDFDLPAETLSGGQKKLVALVALSLEHPDVLLLDEPDNHLDLQGKQYLESFIHDYEGAVVLVSHDRYLLDEVVTEIVELENGRLTVYQGNYTAYKTERELRRLRQQQMYAAQQKEIARIEAAIERFERWAHIVVNERHIKQARHRRRMLERMEERGEIVESVSQRRLMDIQLAGWRGSNKVLEITDLSMVFDDELLFADLDLLVYYGDRVGLIGPNGAGKSILFRLILETLQPTTGVIKVGPSVQMGYYAQEHQTLAAWLDRTPLELVRDTKPMSESDAVAQLISFAFAYEQVRQPIGTLSGGERSRLQLLSLMLTQPNLLLLDEPTNNLDIASSEVLEGALEDFLGTIVIISHDRYFLDQTVDRIVELKDGKLTTYQGGYTDYLYTQEGRS